MFRLRTPRSFSGRQRQGSHPVSGILTRSIQDTQLATLNRSSIRRRTDSSLWTRPHLNLGKSTPFFPYWWTKCQTARWYSDQTALPASDFGNVNNPIAGHVLVSPVRGNCLVEPPAGPFPGFRCQRRSRPRRPRSSALQREGHPPKAWRACGGESRPGPPVCIPRPFR